jgi:uncharacterized protein (UPF0297 family)
MIELYLRLNEEGRNEVMQYIVYIASQERYISSKKESKNA